MDKKQWLIKTKVIGLLVAVLMVGAISTNSSHNIKPVKSELLTNESMMQLLGGDITITIVAKDNTGLIGVVIGATIGFLIAGPGGAIEGAFWGALFGLLL